MKKTDKDKLKSDWLARKGARVKVKDLLPAKLRRDCVSAITRPGGAKL